MLNDTEFALEAALGSPDLAFLPEDKIERDVAAGRLIRVLADWSPPFPGNHLYYPSRRQPTPAFAVLIEPLRHRS